MLRSMFGVCLLFFFLSCSKEKETLKETRTPLPPIVYNDAKVPDQLKMNQLQYLSSHNSYRKHTDKEIYLFLNHLLPFASSLFMEWQYDHVDFYTQLERYGVRHLEIDIYGDKNGGRFYNRAGYTWTGRDPESHILELEQSGLKVLHIPDIDFETNYYTFIDALKDIKRWSDHYPDHLPVYIYIETKTATVGDFLSGIGFTKAEIWDADNTAEIEKEILSVFPINQIIKPDDIRRNHLTLREGVLQDGWLTIGEARGKVMFMFDVEDFSNEYKKGSPSLEGKLVFTPSKESDPDAAFMKRNDPFASDIESLVKKGYLVRSMIGGVEEAKSGDYSKWEAGKSKGVHFLSTDYYKPDDRGGKVKGWTDFHVFLENNSYQLNPITN
ncbi:MAG: phosphatidylinositol-specific phospholipase C1-like protein [Chitinophagales bacterium]|nr:phosphatidylinositol-specific phospholipase C1-like protein [Chitinophagales bacterium]